MAINYDAEPNGESQKTNWKMLYGSYSDVAKMGLMKLWSEP